MNNRLRGELWRAASQEPREDFWEMWGDAGWFPVSEETARAVVGQLAHEPPPRWLRFVDLFGAEVRVLAEGIVCVRECTRAHRDATRAFGKARREEQREDGPPWEDE